MKKLRAQFVKRTPDVVRLHEKQIPQPLNLVGEAVESANRIVQEADHLSQRFVNDGNGLVEDSEVAALQQQHGFLD